MLKRNECYDLKANTWQFITQLHHRRKYASACAFNKESIYIFGGTIKDECDKDFIELNNPVKDEMTLMDTHFMYFMKNVCPVKVNKKLILIFGGQ